MLAVAERVVNRGSSAIVSVVMLFFVTPAQLGLYAGAMLVYTLAQMIGEIALRQSATPMWFHPDGPGFIRRASIFLAAASSTCSIAYACILLLAGKCTMQEAAFLGFLSVAAIAACLAQPRLTRAQASEQWSMLAKAQLRAAGVSMLAGLCIVPFFGILGGITQSVVLEVAFLAFLPRASLTPIGSRPHDSLVPIRSFRDMAVSNALGWSQTQSERVAAGVWAGASVLGSYSAGYQIGRSLAEPVAAGLVNVLRTQLVLEKDPRPELVRASLGRAWMLGLVLQGACIILLALPLSFLLPAEWRESIGAAIVLSGGLPSLLLVWVASTVLIVDGRTRVMLPWQILGIVLSVVAGLAMAHSLWAGLIVLGLRDLISCVSRILLATGPEGRHLVPWPALVAVGSQVVAWLISITVLQLGSFA